MRSPRATVVVGLTSAALLVTGCGQSDSPTATSGVSAPAATGAANEPEASRSPEPTPVPPDIIADGVTLRAGADGTLPVKVRWVQAFSAPEWIAVDGDVVYVADEVLSAIRLSDGAVQWEAGGDSSGNGLAADGGVRIGRDGPNRIRVWAPWNYDLTVNENSGRVLRHRRIAGGRKPPELTVFRISRPTRFRVNVWDPERVVARWPGGRVAWRIIIHEPWYPIGPAIEIPGGLVLLISSGHLVALDYL